jgi:hypothetical protein
MSKKTSPHIEGKYKVVGQLAPAGRMYSVRYGKTIDFATISLAEADRLYEDGCPYLEKVHKPPRKPEAVEKKS